jgi:ribose transport system substrate-binding protein
MRKLNRKRQKLTNEEEDQMSRPSNWLRAVLVLCTAGVLAFGLAACGDDDDDDGGGETASFTPEHNPDFFDRQEMEKQLAQRDVEPEDFGAGNDPWVQAIEPELVDTSEYKKEGPWNICFSNAAVDNPWRVVGWTTMQAQVEALSDEIADFNAVDAEASDDKQISDIQSLTRGDQCDALIVSPNTTATLTPAVEQACDTGIPVIVFDRGVDTDCPVTFIHPIGGYAFGADAAEFLVDNVDSGGKILALRILPGVDVLETRWSAAQEVFADSELEIVGDEQTEGDAANTKQIVSDYITREGELDGIWMDAGATAVAAAEAFEDAGQEIPPITGEDQLDFLRKWQEDDLTAIAPVYSNYQWRTPIIAATRILSGEEVPKEWVLPQPAVTQDQLDDVVAENEGLPDLHYALCGCEDLPGYPERWSD